MKTGLLLILAFLIGFGGVVLWANFSKNTDQKPVRIMVVISPTPAVEPVTIMAVGDVMLSRSVLEQMERRGDFSWPFASTAATLKTADLTIGNLETPVNETCPPMNNRMIFCAPQPVLGGLTAAGFDALSLENNHSTNQFLQGKVETQSLLAGKNIMGLEEQLTNQEIRGLKIGLMAFDDVSRPLNEIDVKQAVASAAAQVDVLVGFMHWGVEYTHEPTGRQQALGHLMVDSGMRVVIGAHPHWTQPVEEYHGGLIFYSLGNFVFDQMWSEETRQGSIALLKFKVQSTKVKTINYELIPVKIYEYGQPRIEP